MVPEDDDVVVIRLQRKEKKVKLVEESGTERNLTLKEMTGANRDRYRTSDAKRFKMSADGKSIQVGDLLNQQADLIAACLYDEYGKPVPVSEIAQWTASVQESLFELCQKMNGMNKAAEDDAKKV
jgi:chitinase